MLFIETLKHLKPTVDEALDELFDTVKRVQTHEQDLLLVQINGFYEKMYEDPIYKNSPFVFGPGGWHYNADETQYSFYDSYRRSAESTPREEYFQDYDTNKDKQHGYGFLLQIELMIFLKFWESEMMLKRLYQLSNLAQGKNYDWHFEITVDDSRHEIIRGQIRDSIKTICPKYYELLKDIYLSQIRNAAAHSQFYIAGTKLGFANYHDNPKKHAPLSQIDFLDWENRFHKLILLYDGLLRRFGLSHNEYVQRQEDKEFGLQVRETRRDGSERISFIKYVTANRTDWMWYETWKQHHKGK